MIRIVGLDHIVLRTNQLQRMLDFYVRVLGCELERELSELGLSQLRAGNALIDIVPVDGVLGSKGGGAPTKTERNMEHFCLQIEPEDEGAIKEYLLSCHVDFEDFEERYGAQGFGRSIYIEDPEGNVVELKPRKS